MTTASPEDDLEISAETHHAASAVRFGARERLKFLD
jgi:hypothetical protein